MIGQEKLIDDINKYTLQTLPRTLLFLGEYGSGRKTLVKFIANKFSLPIIEITTDTTAEQLTEYSQSVIKSLYLINLDNIKTKSQNKLLKFIEEPSVNSFNMLIAESEAQVLPTILNRCIIYRLEEYSVEQLKQIASYSDECIYKVCRTPGQIKNIDEQSFKKLYNLCETIVNKANKASFANTLSIATKINFKEDFDKYDFVLFFKLLNYVSFNCYIKNRTKLSELVFWLTSKYINVYKNNTVDKQKFTNLFLVELYEESKKVH